MLTLGQAAKQVGVSKSALSRAVTTGELSALRREDGSYSVEPSELERYVEANKHRFPTAARRQVAELFGVTTKTIQRWEEAAHLGRSVPFGRPRDDRDTILRLAGILQIERDTQE